MYIKLKLSKISLAESMEIIEAAKNNIQKY